jgi:NTE family protein
MKREKKKISLALQGGGSHGAFTWGIMERLLEEDVLDIKGICGTSAGAMNAAVTAYGLHQGGNAGAIDLLEKFWKKVADSAKYSPLQPSWLDSALYPGDMNFSAGFQFFSLMTQTLSPYQFNPMDKAGSYGIQEWIGYCKIRKIEGEYANVMGLPVYAIYEELLKF